MALSDYHLFAIPMSYSERGEISESIKFTELRNVLSDGYRSQVLLGSNTGVRRWRITMPTLAGLSVLPGTVTGINGELLSREAYIFDLFCETKITGTPFAFQSPHNGQYYLVEFADEELTYDKLRVQIYSTGVELVQVRELGQTVYYPADLEGLYGWYVGDEFPAPFPGGWGNTITDNGDPSQLLQTGNVEELAAGLNGHQIVQFNVTTNDGFLQTSFAPSFVTLREVFLVMQMREATFSNFAGIITSLNSTGLNTQVLIGDSGTTKFLDPGAAVIEYRLNDTLYANNDRQAPMNAWGIVHVRHTGVGWTFDEIQVGKDRDFAGRFAEVDIAEMLFFNDLQPMNVRRELFESLVVKYQIGA